MAAILLCRRPIVSSLPYGESAARSVAPPSPREIYGTGEQHRGRIVRFRVKRSRSMYVLDFKEAETSYAARTLYLGKLGGIAQVRAHFRRFDLNTGFPFSG